MILVLVEHNVDDAQLDRCTTDFGDLSRESLISARAFVVISVRTCRPQSHGNELEKHSAVMVGSIERRNVRVVVGFEIYV